MMQRSRSLAGLALVTLSVSLLVACSAPSAGTPAGATSAPAAKPAATSAPASTSVPAASAPAPAAPPPRARIEFAMVARVVSSWHTFVAQELGFFDRQGIDLDVTLTESNSRSTQGLVANAYGLSGQTPDALIQAVERGGNNELVIVAGDLNEAIYSLITSKGITSYNDLRGKTLGVSAINDGTTVLLRKMLAANGLRPTDYDIVAVGGTGNRASGISSGAIAGGLIGQPQDFALLDEGFPSLGLTTEYIPDYQFQVVATRRDWARQNEGVLLRYLRAIIEADAWIYDRANREEAARVLSEATRAPLNASLRTYDLVVERYQAIPRAGEVDREGLQAVIETMAEVDLLSRPLPSADKFLDLSYLEKARAQ